MGLDIRLPIGLMFAVIGVILITYGAITSGDSAVYARSLAININIWWGAVMLAFGALMLVLGRRGHSGVPDSNSSAEGRAIETREKDQGLET